MISPPDRVQTAETGFGLIEVMFAMVILAFAILGVMATYQWSDHGVQEGRHRTLALAIAQARLEAKRAAPWHRLLLDDLDGDGLAELTMLDDGQGLDALAGDGTYTGSSEVSGIQLVWTVQPQPHGALAEAGAAVIRVQASYSIGHWGKKHLEIGTLRANPTYSGR